jgi:hypothetical protein
MDKTGKKLFMKKEEIIEGNKLIAEFMNLPSNNTSEELQYHLSWDWIIPVVEKINQSNKIDYYKHRFTMGFLEEYQGYYCRFNHVIKHKEFSIGKCKSQIEAVYKVVVQFIKWYNQNK